MLKRFSVLVILICLISVGFSTGYAQRPSPACNFEPNPEATVFENLQHLAAQGIRIEDINELAQLVRDPTVNAWDFLLSKGYPQAQIEAFLSDETTVFLLNQLLHPSPSRDILERANALLTSYGLSSGALIELYKLVTDPQALYDTLIAYGLSPEQADGFTNEALELADEAQRIGVFDYAATLDGQDVLDKYGYDTVRLNSLGSVLDDPDALRAELLRQGVSDADVDDIVADFQYLREEAGLSGKYLKAWATKSLAYTLDFYGVPSTKIFTLAAQGDSAAIRDCLSGAGFDESAIDIAASEFGLYLFGDYDEAWITSKTIIEVVYDDAGTFAYEWGLSSEELAELSLYGSDLDTLFEILTQEYGFSDEDAEYFLFDFDGAIFSSVFDSFDDDYLYLLDSAIEAIEYGEYFELDDDFDFDSFWDDFLDFDDDFDDFDDEDFDDFDDLDDFDDDDFDDEDFDDYDDFDDEDFDDEG